MKRILLLPALIILLFSACKKEKEETSTTTEENNNNNNNNNGEPTIYIKFKADGTQVTFTTAGATRSSVSGDQEATLTGTVSGASNPNVDIFVNSGFIGVTAGLNAPMYDGTYSSFEYTNSTGTTFSSATASSGNDEGIDFYVSACSYSLNGNFQGSFSGSIKNGTTVMNITEGTYKVTFSN